MQSFATRLARSLHRDSTVDVHQARHQASGDAQKILSFDPENSRNDNLIFVFFSFLEALGCLCCFFSHLQMAGANKSWRFVSPPMFRHVSPAHPCATHSTVTHQRASQATGLLSIFLNRSQQTKSSESVQKHRPCLRLLHLRFGQQLMS